MSAHWDADVATVQSQAAPPLLYDYKGEGFPEEAFQLQWPAPGAPQLAARVRSLLSAAGLPSAEGAWSDAHLRGCAPARRARSVSGKLEAADATFNAL